MFVFSSKNQTYLKRLQEKQKAIGLNVITLTNALFKHDKNRIKTLTCFWFLGRLLVLSLSSPMFNWKLDY